MIDLNELSDLLWESFKNTHDHGREDADGNIISDNFRAIIIQQQDITDLYLDQWCGENPSQSQQDFRRIWYGTAEKYFFLDMSVIDFGKGFVELAKFKADTEDDIEVFLMCLNQGWSRLNDKSRGSGFTKILNCIHKYSGWLRIRTGNILLEKTFSRDGPEVTKHDIKVLETHVTGSSIHISLPLHFLT